MKKIYKTSVYLVWVIIVLLTFAAPGCKKSGEEAKGYLPKGTKVVLHGITLPEAAEPFVVDSIYNQSTYSITFYYCTDANGKTWEIPEDDLIIVK